MRTRFPAALALLSLLALPAWAQPRPGGAGAVASVPWANKLFLESVEANPTAAPPVAVSHDFGTVPHGTVLTHTFTLTNIYDAPLQVSDIRLSCGCLKAEPPQRVLQPNEKAPFTVTMDTAKFSGPNTQTLYVTVGPTFVSTAILRISANSQTDVTLSAPGELQFGTVAAGGSPTKTLTVEYRGSQPGWAVTAPATPSPHADIAVTPSGKGKFTITATLKPEAAAGSITEIVSLRTTDPKAPVLPITLRAVVQAPAQASPDRVSLGSVRVGETVFQKVIIRSTGGGKFKAEPVFDPETGLSVETLGTQTPVQSVTIRLTPTAAMVGQFRRTIGVRTSINGGTTVPVQVEATVEPASILPPGVGK